MKRKRFIVSVDPGVVTLGVAVWNAADAFKSKTPRPCSAHAYTLSREFKGSPYHKALRMGEYVRKEIAGFTIDQLICEVMEFRSNARGVAAIDDVLNVSFACGVMAQVAVEHGAAFQPAPVSQWKGQLSKEQVARRILKKWGGQLPEFLSDPSKPSHDWDAVGIGLWSMGFFE